MGGLSNFETWRTKARRRLPRFAFDFADGGVDDEVTLRRNEAAFRDLSLIPRLMRAIEDASAATELFGEPLKLPVLLAPTGDSRILGPQADYAQARGARAAGTISILSAVASTAPERVAAAVPGPGWAQIFLFKDRDLTQQAVDRLKRVGFAALVLTVDGPVKGNRERDARNGFQLPLLPSRRVTLDALRQGRWKWYWDYFTNEPHAEPARHTLVTRVRNFGGYRDFQLPVHPATLAVNHHWEDLDWLRTIWDGPLLLKGVMCGEDAERALAAGCDGVIVSNHGGRELDEAPASIEMLPEVVEAVGGRMEVLVDGGFRRGTDVVKALSLGARACLVGRPWLFALAAGGGDGVTQMLEQFRAEIVRAMQLVGVTSVEQLGPDNLRRRPGSGWEPVRHHEATL